LSSLIHVFWTWWKLDNCFLNTKQARYEGITCQRRLVLYVTSGVLTRGDVVDLVLAPSQLLPRSDDDRGDICFQLYLNEVVVVCNLFSVLHISV
jgi:hypothetical protein